MIDKMAIYVFFMLALLQFMFSSFFFYEKNPKVKGIPQFTLFTFLLLISYIVLSISVEKESIVLISAYSLLLAFTYFYLCKAFIYLLNIRHNIRYTHMWIVTILGVTSFFFINWFQLAPAYFLATIELVSGIAPLIYLTYLISAKSRSSEIALEIRFLAGILGLLIVGKIFYFGALATQPILLNWPLYMQSVNFQVQMISLASMVFSHVMLLVCFLILLFKFKEIELNKAVETDHLTGVYNRRAFFDKMKNFTDKNHLYFIMIDADYFKRINDNYGHLVGDEALKHIANVVSQNISQSDLLARYGGEEFIIAISAKSKGDIKNIVERIRRSMERTPLVFENNTIPITLSIGVSQYSNLNDSEDIKIADEMLYQAKKNGRNQAIFGFA